MQESTVCARYVQGGAHVFRCPWCVEVSTVYEEVSMCMYRSVLELVCRACMECTVTSKLCADMTCGCMGYTAWYMDSSPHCGTPCMSLTDTFL